MVAIGFRKWTNTYLARFIVFFAVTAFFLKLGLWTAVPPYYISPIWPVVGAATGLCIVWGYKYLPAIAIGLFTGLYFHNYSVIELLISPLKIALSMTVFLTLVIAVKTIVYNRIMKNEDIFSSISSLIKMVCLFIVLSVFAFFAIMVFSHYYLVIPERLANMIMIKWTGADLAGTLLFIPGILCIGRSDLKSNSNVKVYEYYILVAFPVIIGLTFLKHLLSANYLVLIIIPFLLFVSYRYSLQIVMVFTVISFYLLDIYLLMNIAIYKTEDYIAISGFYQILFILELIGLLMINIIIGRSKKS
jgi:hypothetical protein